MHSKIIEIVGGLDKPIRKKDWAKATDLPEHFVGGIADYTDDVSDKQAKEVKDSFVQYFGDHCVREGNWITFDVEAKKMNEEGRYRDFIEKAKAVAALSFDTFCGLGDTAVMDHLIWELNDKYNDQFSLYIFNSAEEDLLTFDEWKRKLQPGERYFMGGVMDYHW